jgi:hypothetical protein
VDGQGRCRPAGGGIKVEVWSTRPAGNKAASVGILGRVRWRCLARPATWGTGGRGGVCCRDPVGSSGGIGGRRCERNGTPSAAGQGGAIVGY